MIAAVVLGTFISLVVSYHAWVYLTSPLKTFPSGHWSSGFSNVWRLFDVWSRRAELTHIRLHDQHGNVVRMGPNTVSVSDPVALKDVFRTLKPWQKTPMYGVNDVMVNGQRISNVFGTRDENWHSTVMRPIKGMYSMTRSLDMEPHIDATIQELLDTFDKRFVKSGQVLDLGEWVPYFTWDSMGRQTFGKSYGLIEAGEDKGGMVMNSTAGLDYFATISQIPILDLLLDKNPIKRIGPPPFVWATAQAFTAVAERISAPSEEQFTRQSDFLDKFLEAKKAYPDIVNDFMVVNYLLINILAGSDTTAIYALAAMYYILKTPDVLPRIQEELASLKVRGPVSWKDSQRLPYLKATMQEAQRIHPGVGIMMERYVPDAGYKLPDGRFLPGGTIVGCNPWVVNRREDIFGANPHAFIPDRWLQGLGEDDNAYMTRIKNMQSADMTFGAGKRTCLGRNVGVLTATKVVASLFNAFEVALVDPNKEWTVHNSWFVYQYNINVTLRPRKV